MELEPSTLLSSAAAFANALKENPAAIYVVYIVFAIVVGVIGYMVLKLCLEHRTESRTDKILDKVDQNLTENVKVLSQVVLSLERINK